MGTRTTTFPTPSRLTITLLATLSLLASQFVFFATTPAFALSVNNDLNQWANGAPGTDPAVAGQWQNGNLNSNNSQYREGDSVSFRRPMSGFEAGKTYRVTINYDTVNNSLVAYDYLTSWNRTPGAGNPTSGLAAFDGAPSDTHLIPVDPRLGVTPAFTGTVVGDGERQMAIWGGTILDVGNYGYSQGGSGQAYSGSGTTTTSLDIVFTADSANVMLAWGGHISVASQWTYPTAPRNTNGSPYHMRNIGNVAELAGAADPTVVDTSNVGNQDRSLKASAVLVPGLNLSKSIVDDPGTVEAGDQFTYRIVVSNDGEAGSSLSNVHVTDTIEDIFPVQSISPSAGVDCGASSGQSIDCTIATLTGGASVTIDIVVAVQPTTDPEACDTYWNAATATAGDLTSSDAVDIEVVGCDPELDIVKRAEQGGQDITGGSVSLGDTFTYVIEVTNDEDAVSKAVNVVITDEITSALNITGTPTWDVTPAPLADGDCSLGAEGDGPTGGTVVTCSVGDLEPGQTARVEIDVLVPRVANSCSPQDNLAAANADNHDEIEIDEPVTVDIEGCEPELSFVKTVDDASIAPGGSTTYRITASNASDATETARVLISDVVDDVFTIGTITHDAAPGAQVTGFDCSASGQTVTCGEVDLEPGDSFTVSIPVTAAVEIGDLEDDTMCGTVPNTASLYLDGDELTGDEDVIGNWDPSASVTIDGCEADVSLEKSVDVTSISVDDGIAVYTLRIDNDGDATASALGVELSDTIHDAFVITGVSYTTTGTEAAGFECGAAGQDVDCGAVDLAPGEYLEVEVTVMAADGVDLCDTYPNVFSAIWTDAGTDESGDATSDDDADLTIDGCIADVTLDKDVDVDSILIDDPDSTATYRLRATVSSDSTASVPELTISDDTLDDTVFEVVGVTAYIVPAGAMTLAELVVVPCDAPESGTSVSCELPAGTDLLPGDAFVVEIEVRSIGTTLDACAEWPNVASLAWTDAYDNSGTDDDDALLVVEGCAPAISLVKDVDPGVVTITPDDEPPFEVTYTYTITNTGNVDLFDLTLDDDVIGDLTGQLTVTDLPIGASTTVEVVYELTEDDIAAGSVDNIAIVTGVADDDTTVSAEDDATVEIVVVLARILGLDIVKEALITPDANGDKTITIDQGDDATVTYRYTITNTGTEELVDLTLVDDVIGDLTDELAAVLPGLSLAAGASVVVTVDYELTAAQIAAGEVENVAIVSGEDELGAKVTASDDEIVKIVEVLEVVKVLPRTLPKTGADTLLLAAGSMLVLALGAAVLLLTPRRRRGTV